LPTFIKTNLRAYGLSLLLVGVTLGVLFWMGQPWWCSCGEAFLWSGDVWTQHNSQHFIDPYGFTHVSHGLIFAAAFLFVPVIRKWSFAWRLFLGLLVEVSWEVVENTPMVINRYRESTMSLGYTGDSVANSLGDIVCFAIGFVIASRVKWYWSLGLFLVMEAVLLLTIRDNLILNVLMLLWPVEAVKQWQAGL